MSYYWLLFALLSALFAALVAIFGKIGLQHLDSSVATTVRAGIMFFVLLFVLLFTNKIGKTVEIFKDSKALLFIFLSGLAGALSWLFYFLALKIGEASKVAPIDRLSIVFVLILAALVLGEKLTIKTILGTVIIVVGAIFVAL